MARVQAKICGVSTPEAIDTAVAGGASHVGFVFFPKSPRNLDPDRLAALAARLPDRVKAVGVFVNPDDALLARTVPHLSAIQLHGSEAPERAAAIRARFDREVWKAVSVRTRADLDAARAFTGAADRIVYDARTPEGTLPGGMGLRFDWRLLEGFAHPLPWALSGGLDADNVVEAVGITGARLVDVSSGVEGAPGVKDVTKITAFLKAISIL
ncbi:phosphoribosylanthranilate isomerase [Sphingomonas sp. ID0503]|uniref:phosphoribosylanthranilate isomerase n=1 Tax=Sphingomonas sp. ID0503 TaxID=3399691 RepID=UPI003AFB2784